MLALDQITTVARDVAKAKFGKRLENVRVEEMSDWTGTDALDVLIVVRPSAVRLLNNTDAAPEILHEIGDRLNAMGETRFAYVGYATQAELDAVDDPES